ncbi:arsenate reductase ArsC [Mariniphaga sediminis]|uniref:Arsenate reductase ArsC n=1 Tax=Mariniphaga sediminis TaxID=1628158 RepID=A0A399D0L7_9BACT|nr:arsenate reductase ArsC [Mariniphaga sediminis]RIH64963.1 arsenate reductase ArsC [Mariniphaga sediminis]
MKIFFLSNQNSCRSQMAEAILKSYDKELEIYSAGIDPANHVSPIAIEVMAEIGINLEPHVPLHYSKFDHMVFDYLITVGDGTVEELKIPSVKYNRKMHLGFHNPYKKSKNKDEIRQKCREIRDEIKTEMDYFYHRILKKQKEKSG